MKIKIMTDLQGCVMIKAWRTYSDDIGMKANQVDIWKDRKDSILSQRKWVNWPTSLESTRERWRWDGPKRAQAGRLALGPTSRSSWPFFAPFQPPLLVMVFSNYLKLLIYKYVPNLDQRDSELRDTPEEADGHDKLEDDNRSSFTGCFFATNHDTMHSFMGKVVVSSWGCKKILSCNHQT